MFNILHGESVLPNPCLYLMFIKIGQYNVFRCILGTLKLHSNMTANLFRLYYVMPYGSVVGVVLTVKL